MTPQGLARLISDEGSRPYLYDDKTGERVTKLPSGGNPTIGVGLNLGAQELTNDEITYLFNNRLNIFWNNILHLLPWVAGISPIAQDVILMVEFNTGDVFAFRNMLAAMKSNQMTLAATELMKSKAAAQLPTRYTRMQDALIDGHW